jgi:hypothetical protein
MTRLAKNGNGRDKSTDIYRKSGVNAEQKQEKPRGRKMSGILYYD